MELHSPASAKKLWNYLRVAFFMARKGLVSKRKLLVDMHLMMKRGKLVGKKTLNNLLFHNHSPRSRGFPGYGLREYEFSCSNSPNPVFFHASATTKRRHNYFPCIHAIAEEEPDETPRPDNRSLTPSPLSVRVVEYSSEDDNDDGQAREVDDAAEEFIRRFYEQLRAQSRIALLQ